MRKEYKVAVVVGALLGLFLAIGESRVGSGDARAAERQQYEEKYEYLQSEEAAIVFRFIDSDVWEELVIAEEDLPMFQQDEHNGRIVIKYTVGLGN